MGEDKSQFHAASNGITEVWSTPHQPHRRTSGGLEQAVGDAALSCAACKQRGGMARELGTGQARVHPESWNPTRGAMLEVATDHSMQHGTQCDEDEKTAQIGHFAHKKKEQTEINGDSTFFLFSPRLRFTNPGGDGISEAPGGSSGLGDGGHPPARKWPFQGGFAWFGWDPKPTPPWGVPATNRHPMAQPWQPPQRGTTFHKKKPGFSHFFLEAILCDSSLLMSVTNRASPQRS